MIKEKVVERRKSPRAKDNFSVEIIQENASLIADTINCSMGETHGFPRIASRTFIKVRDCLPLPIQRSIIGLRGKILFPLTIPLYLWSGGAL